jgi:phosphatidylserine decarboxylase
MRVPIADEGWRVIGFLFLCAIFIPMLPWLGWAKWPLWALAFFSITFFRDPERELPAGDDLILSPADGTVVRIAEVDEPEFFHGKARVVCIFMSPLNCHINRAPVAGKVMYKKYNPGRFEMAWRDKASELNEQTTIGIQNTKLKVLVRQIAGFLARRIICRVNVEDELQRGERFGLIQFGSRVDVFLPLDAAVLVNVNQAVKGGLTVLGEVA